MKEIQLYLLFHHGFHQLSHYLLNQFRTDFNSEIHSHILDYNDQGPRDTNLALLLLIFHQGYDQFHQNHPLA